MHTITWWTEPLIESLKIVSFVMIIMMLMEFVSLRRHNGKNQTSKKNYIHRLFSAVGLGLIPGCVGGFTVVSLYTHGMFSFGGVLGASFTALGDDAFRMFSIMPMTTIWVSLALIVLALLVGFIVDKIPYFKHFKTSSNTHIEIHSEDCHISQKTNFKWISPQKWSFTRALLVGLFAVYILALMSGKLSHSHGIESCEHGHLHEQSTTGFDLGFENIIFMSLGFLGMILVLRVDEHFLEAHLWQHVIKKHFLSIFLWTLLTIYALNVLNSYVDIAAWLSHDTGKLILILLAAIAVGWIPQSGPHFAFAQLFFMGSIPFSVFFANAIVQDGHTSLVLLAESRKQFVWLKVIKSVVALLVCGVLIALGH